MRGSFLEGAAGIHVGSVGGCNVLDGVAHLQPGDSLTFYTDGVTEAENASGEFFTETRLRSVLEGDALEPVAQSVAEVLSMCQIFTEGLEQGDDITLLAVRFRPAA